MVTSTSRKRVRDLICEGGRLATLYSIGIALAVAPAPLSAQGEMPRTVVGIETTQGTVEVHVEVARTPDHRAAGLMERPSLPDSSGMLFLFERRRDPGAGFYMYRTRIPLDIAYADADGRIVRILTMPPCASERPESCPQYPPGQPYWMALEVNAGFFAARGVAVGDRVHVRIPLDGDDRPGP